MRQTLSLILLFTISLTLKAQHEITKFLGIPVDGKKAVMIQKLKEKGFKTNPYNKDFLDGFFNGIEVEVYVVTNNDKVCRIMLCDKKTQNATDIKIRFNKLCEQFKNNKKYIPGPTIDYTLPENEDIAYEIAVHQKRYEAIFLQLPTTEKEKETIDKNTFDIIKEKYFADQIENPTPEQKEDMDDIYISKLLENCANRPVWFMISDSKYGEYYITMFYDNEYNRANGEDL